MHQRRTLRSKQLRSKQLRSKTIGSKTIGSPEPTRHTSVTTAQSGNGVSSRGGIINQRSVKEFSRPDYELAERGNVSEFYPEAVRNNQSGGLDIFLVPGYVWCDDPLSAAQDPAGPGWFYTMPEFNGTALDVTGENRPRFSVNVGESIYAKVERDGTGIVVTPVEMAILDSEEDPGHYQPVDSEQAAEPGEFEYIEILQVKEEEGRLVITQLHSGPIKFAVTLVGSENVGGFAEVHQRYERNEGLNKYRTLQRGWGSLVTQETDSIQFVFDGISVGDGEEILVPEGEMVAGADAEQAAFRTIKGGPSGRDEIEVRQVGGTIEVLGNGNDGSLIFIDETGTVLHTHSWVDGLVTTGSGELRFRKFAGPTERITTTVSVQAPVPMAPF